MLVINTNNHAVPVKIQTPDGPDSVHIQAKGRVNLGEGRTIDPNWLAREGAGIRVVAPAAAKPTTPIVDSEE